MLRLKGACTDWTTYIEIKRPNCLILMRFAKKPRTKQIWPLNLDISTTALRLSGVSMVARGRSHITEMLGPAFLFGSLIPLWGQQLPKTKWGGRLTALLFSGPLPLAESSIRNGVWKASCFI